MKRRKRRWKPPNNPTAQAREVWAAVYPTDSWPKGWRVEWAGFMRGVGGLTIYGRRLVLLNHADAKRDGRGVEILLHELVHMRAGETLRHGSDFLRLLNAARSRLGFEPTTPQAEWR